MQKVKKRMKKFKEKDGIPEKKPADTTEDEKKRR